MLYYITLLLIGCCCLMTSSSDSSLVPPELQLLDGICMARRTDRLVYRHKDDNGIYIAFDVLKKGKVHVYSWEVIKASKGTFISSMKSETVLAIDFRKKVDRSHILGACGKGRYKKFRNRLLRKMKSCNGKKASKKLCKITDIISVFVRLKIRKVKFNKNPDDECDL